MVHCLCPLPGASSAFYHTSWQVFWREKKNRSSWNPLELSSFSRYPPSVHLSSVRHFCGLPCISRHRVANILMNTANVRVNLWIRNTSFIWKQKEVDALTQIGRFPLESVDLCQYMPCFSFAKSLLLNPLTILFSRLHLFSFWCCHEMNVAIVRVIE